MASSSTPKHLKEIITTVNEKLKLIKQPNLNGEIFETQQVYHDEVFMVSWQAETCSYKFIWSIMYR